MFKFINLNFLLGLTEVRRRNFSKMSSNSNGCEKGGASGSSSEVDFGEV